MLGWVCYSVKVGVVRAMWLFDVVRSARWDASGRGGFACGGLHMRALCREVHVVEGSHGAGCIGGRGLGVFLSHEVYVVSFMW